MKIDIVTKEELAELKAIMLKVQDLLEAREEENYDWTDSKGMQEMLNCSEGALLNYRNSGLLPLPSMEERFTTQENRSMIFSKRP